ncbi:MAG TPA: putative manganese-dependent inorganic diphosphatase [Opitutales bacterium]|nr:putative manganese-dependent inorganic diphosphatase [Opitutales bacterium]
MSTATTYILGHRNPDADSICAAIAYANFKHLIGQTECVAARCGNSNARIDAILHRFDTPLPLFLGDVTPRVRDIMVTDLIKARSDATCAEVLELIEHYDVRILPVTDSVNRLDGFISVFQLGEFFIPKLLEPRAMQRVHSDLKSIAASLKATILHQAEGKNEPTDLYVEVGAMDLASFDRFSDREKILPEQLIVVVGDREEIQRKSIEAGVHLLVISDGLEVKDEILDLAREQNVHLIVSPYDPATTAWAIRSASTIDHLVERDFYPFKPDIRLAEARRKVSSINASAFMVVNSQNELLGIFTRTDLLKPVPTNIILVDHNELSQAVPGAAEVNILEIIDHHRLGNLHTQQPILFINEPVGSTCTIIADLFRRESLVPSPEIAGLMMSGIISDTLNLHSPTTTGKDEEIIKWLSPIAGIDNDKLADLIFSSGSVILDNDPEKVIRSDFKSYTEFGIRFSVSQVEELGFENFKDHSEELIEALKDVRKTEGFYFSSLLVTDINTQNSLLVIAGNREFIDQIPYPVVQKNEIFDLPGIVSRKKQLIPFLTGLLRILQPN